MCTWHLKIGTYCGLWQYSWNFLAVKYFMNRQNHGKICQTLWSCEFFLSTNVLKKNFFVDEIMSTKQSSGRSSSPSIQESHIGSSIVKKTKRNKNGRTKFMSLDVSMLQACGTAFGYFPDKVELSSMSTILGKSPRSIQVWFQNVRQRKITTTVQNYLDACQMLSYDLDDF